MSGNKTIETCKYIAKVTFSDSTGTTVGARCTAKCDNDCPNIRVPARTITGHCWRLKVKKQ